jgi:tRNA(Ile2)-agmatinylcytidine synthase
MSYRTRGGPPGHPGDPRQSPEDRPPAPRRPPAGPPPAPRRPPAGPPPAPRRPPTEPPSVPLPSPVRPARWPARLASFIYRPPCQERGGKGLLLGIDDTDSLKGGCTTHVIFQVILELRRRFGLAPIEHPRLVRLNPANPWKTRGNAALSVRLGEARGDPRTIGSWRGTRIQMHPKGVDVPPSEKVLDAAWTVVGALTWPEGDRTNPGIVLTASPGPEEWYREALHELVEVAPVEARLREAGALTRSIGTRRGLIGAAASVAWPGEPHTWELIAYRPKERWGAPREVDPSSVLEMQRAVPSTFDSFDEQNGEPTMVPSSPCPVLYGIRGTEPGHLPRALGKLRGEQPEGWIVFRTNQGTDDHLVAKALGEVRANESVAVAAEVSEAPRTLRGGHVVFPVRADGASMDVAAYEPTKGFRQFVRGLRPGDRLVACGTVRDEPRTLNLEKMCVLALGTPTERVKAGNPRCPECGKAMKSAGTGAGFRCARCGRKAPAEAARFKERPRDLAPGWYEVPTDARRHLARPLKLGVRDELERMASAPPRPEGGA